MNKKQYDTVLKEIAGPLGAMSAVLGGLQARIDIYCSGNAMRLPMLQQVEELKQLRDQINEGMLSVIRNASQFEPSIVEGIVAEFKASKV